MDERRRTTTSGGYGKNQKRHSAFRPARSPPFGWARQSAAPLKFEPKLSEGAFTAVSSNSSKCRQEVASDVISDIAVEWVGTNVPVKLRDSRSNIHDAQASLGTLTDASAAVMTAHRFLSSAMRSNDDIDLRGLPLRRLPSTVPCLVV